MFQSILLTTIWIVRSIDNVHTIQNKKESGDHMSYVAPAIREKFETLSIDLKNAILERNVELNNIHDLINVLDAIVKEGEAEEQSSRQKVPSR